jgi:putative SOS response-associated peptidase YedK
MCSRFELNCSSRDIAARFHLALPPALAERSEFRPTDQILVIGPGGVEVRRWGLPVPWESRPLINARAESLTSRPTFRPLLGRRVLVPVTAWWEWRLDGSRRIRTRLSLDRAGPFALAGLEDGGHAVIITCAAAHDLAAVHDRMPAVLPPEAEAAWLDPATDPVIAASMLEPAPGPFLISPPRSPPRQPDLFQ